MEKLAYFANVARYWSELLHSVVGGRDGYLTCTRKHELKT